MKYERRSVAMPGHPAEQKPSGTRDEVGKGKVGDTKLKLTRNVTNKPVVGHISLTDEGMRPEGVHVGRHMPPPPKMMKVNPGCYPPMNKPDHVATYEQQSEYDNGEAEAHDSYGRNDPDGDKY